MATADPAVIQKLTQCTSFTPDEINNMFANFRKISTTVRDDGHIDRQEFAKMMQTQTGGDLAFVDSLFRMFDRDGSGGIDFFEFAVSLAIYQSKATNIADSEKQRIFFKLYDADGDGEISQADLRKMLQSCFASSFMQVPEEEIHELVQATFTKYELTERGTINLASYSKHAFSHSSGYI